MLVSGNIWQLREHSELFARLTELWIGNFIAGFVSISTAMQSISLLYLGYGSSKTTIILLGLFTEVGTFWCSVKRRPTAWQFVLKKG